MADAAAGRSAARRGGEGSGRWGQPGSVTRSAALPRGWVAVLGPDARGGRRGAGRARQRWGASGPCVGWSRAASKRGARAWAGVRLGQGRGGGKVGRALGRGQLRAGLGFGSDLDCLPNSFLFLFLALAQTQIKRIQIWI